jgi:flagellar protein FlaG
MNMSINALGQTMAMEGRKIPSALKENAKPETAPIVTSDPAAVAEKIARNSNKLDESIRELQELSDSMDRKVQFKVNKELDRVVVKIVDPATDKVIKEIPSADIQKLQVRIRETLGLIFDKQI